MELYHLQSFVIVAQEGHLTRASERLYISQPAVSAHIKALEDELGVALFSRTPRGMVLTPAGADLLPRAQAILGQTNDLLAQAKAMQGQLTGEMRIGLNTDSSFLRAAELHRELSQEHPGLSLHLLQRSSWTNIRDIRKNELDAGFVFDYEPQPTPDLCALHLTDVPFVVAAPPGWGHRVDGQPLERLVTLPWIWPTDDCPCRHILDRAFKRLGLEPVQAARADDEFLIRDMISQGVGLSILKRMDALAAGLTICEHAEPFDVGLYLVYRADRENDPLIKAALEALCRVWSLGQPVED